MDTFVFDQGHVTKNQPITLLVLLSESLGRITIQPIFGLGAKDLSTNIKHLHPKLSHSFSAVPQ